jgi:molybdate transport system substrate-binding protein
MSVTTRSARRQVLGLLACAGLLLGSVAGTAPVRADEAPNIAAAASLRYAMDEMASRFEQQTGSAVRLSYGATGSLVHQIENGAPFALFFAADEQSVQRLAKAGRTDGAPSVFAVGRISLVAPKGSPVTVDAEMKGLAAALAAGSVQHFAIANPEVAPYGRAAREALQKSGLWAAAQPRLVLGENVGQAAQFATTGAAEAGIIAYSLVVSADIAPKVTAALIPQAWHQPINHGMALIKGADATSRAFADFVQGPEGRAILERHGFSAP